MLKSKDYKLDWGVRVLDARRSNGVQRFSDESAKNLLRKVAAVAGIKSTN
jgi:hypothetical protein